jgi:hypothetical protein
MGVLSSSTPEASLLSPDCRPLTKKPARWGSKGGVRNEDYPASLEGAPNERLPPDSRRTIAGFEI